MKATGIVRRMDDLGRRIQEEDPHTTLIPIDRFCIAIHSISERIKSGV